MLLRKRICPEQNGVRESRPLQHGLLISAAAALITAAFVMAEYF